ncbi:MAG: Cobalt transport protein CbiM [Phycisphaerae bacterium]|nr:Cobalt transport protein CbiM [Phycisphaerae bacterium]
MHIPDAYVSGQVNAATAVVSAVAVGLAAWRARRTLGERQAPLLGMTAAFVFAAQMLNFPIAGGTSGHFLGALLAAVLMGPLNALLVMTVVLVIQCLVFADGGLTALGSNIFNMGIIGGLAGYAIFSAVRRFLAQTRRGFMAATAVAAWASVVLASAACAVELAISGVVPLRGVLGAMVGVHALIGAGEAIITTAALSVVMAGRPDLVGAWQPAPVGASKEAQP